MEDAGHIYLCPKCGCPVRPIEIFTSKVKGYCPLCDQFVVTNRKARYFRYNLNFQELLRLIALCKEGHKPFKAIEIMSARRDRKLSQSTIERVVLVALKTIGLVKDRNSWGSVAIILSRMDEYDRAILLLSILWNIFCYDMMAKLHKKESNKRGILLLIDQGLEFLSKFLNNLKLKKHGPLDLILLKNKADSLRTNIKKLEENVKGIIELLNTKGSIDATIVKMLKERWNEIKKFYDMVVKYEKELIEAESGVETIRETLKRVKKRPKRHKKSKIKKSAK